MSVRDKILDKIRRNGRGWVFTPSDFLDLGSRDAVDQSLSRLAKEGTVRRLRRGIYDYPRSHRRLGMLAPSTGALAKAVARKDGTPVQASGAQAANALGLSTQVPAHPVFLRDGPALTISVGGRVIRFKSARARQLIGAGRPAGDVFQAIRHLGKGGIGDSVIRRLQAQLPDDVKRDLQGKTHLMSGWMRRVIQEIAAST